jgi:hypothetical protein
MKILILVLTLFAFNLYACNYKLDVKVKPIISLDSSSLQILKEDFVGKMDKMGYKNGDGSSDVSLLYTTAPDIHNPRLTQARVALSYRRAGNLVHYTFGLGNPNRSRRDATIKEEFQQAIDIAVSHLPECN